MAIIDKEDGFARGVSHCCLGNKIVFEPLKTVEVTCPAIVGQANPAMGECCKEFKKVRASRYLRIDLKPCLLILLLSFKDDPWAEVPPISCNAIHDCNKLEIGTL